MLIDCDSCVVRGAACSGCVVSVMLGAPPAGVELDEAERRALKVLAEAGVVPHLRLVTPDSLALDDSPATQAGPALDANAALDDSLAQDDHPDQDDHLDLDDSSGFWPTGKGERRHLRRIA